MPLQDAAQAVAQARRLLGLPATAHGEAWHVRRLNAAGAYFLAHVDGRVACIDATSGALMASASSAHAPVALTREAARALAGVGPDATAELVWMPCAATLSMFDPLWAVARGAATAFVDQRGRLWPALAAAGPG